MEARGAPEEKKSDCVGGGGVVLLLLRCDEGERPSSRLPFLSNGKRDRVKRRLWIFGLGVAAVVKAGAGVGVGATAGDSDAAEANGSVWS